jgi:hypothetical protein
MARAKIAIKTSTQSKTGNSILVLPVFVWRSQIGIVGQASSLLGARANGMGMI